VVTKDVSEGAILFCTETETYFSLNPGGVRIWKLLPPECRTEKELVDRIRRDHPEVSTEVVVSDVKQLLADLLKNRLVEAMQPA
jgi:hypothetical protein